MPTPENAPFSLDPRSPADDGSRSTVDPRVEGKPLASSNDRVALDDVYAHAERLLAALCLPPEDLDEDDLDALRNFARGVANTIEDRVWASRQRGDDEARSAYRRGREDRMRDEHHDRMLRATKAPPDFGIGARGVPEGSPQNIALALVGLGVQFHFDELANRKLVSRAGCNDMERVTDAMIEDLSLEINATYKFMPTLDRLRIVAGADARVHAFHPVRDYLDRLKPWDGVDRTSTWLIRLCGAVDTPFVRAVSRIVLMAAVRRVRRPGAKFDEMLVLESTTQGTDKSTFVRSLCADAEWFGDSFPIDGDAKLVIEQTAGKWIIEAGELAGMSAADHRDLKATLSRQCDEARMAYGHERTDVPRQFIVIGTTNDTEYLKDPTGNRRYWPVEITRCDVRGLVAERDQLWAEAAYLERAFAEDSAIRLPESLWSSAAEEQDKRRVRDPFADVLENVLDGHVGLLAADDLARLVGIDGREPTKQEHDRLRATMSLLKWKKSRRRRGEDRVYSWESPGAVDGAWLHVKRDSRTLKMIVLATPLS